MDNLCRLCSSQSSTLIPVFSIKNGRLLLDMITIVCPVKIDLSDSLPKVICSSCLRIVLDAVDLRERSILSDLTLRSRNLGSQIADPLLKSFKATHKTQIENDSKLSAFTIPVEVVKIEEEKVESNVINFVEESNTSHEDYQSYDAELSASEENCELTEYEPPEKIRKINDERCSNCQCHKASVINHELNEKIKKYFRKPLEKGGKWKCLICQKQYAGQLNNVKEHLSLMHKDIAQMIGVAVKPRPRKLKNDLAKSSTFGGDEVLTI